MKVALVNTPCCEQEYTKFSEKWAFIEDEYIGVNIVHSLLERGGCETVRCNASDVESLLGEVLAAAPDVVMLSVMQTSARTARNLVGRLRDAGYGGKIFIGGWYAKLSWRKIFEECWPVDQVCFTDAEGVLPSWIRNPDGECQGIATYRNYKTIDGVVSIKLDDGVAWPQNYIRPKRDPGRKTYRIETSRGCPHSRCTFCSLSRANVIKGGWAPVPVETILSEVKDIHRRYGATAFSLTDDDMLGPLEKAEERAAELRGAFLSLPFEVKYSGSISVKAATNEKILDLLTESGLVQLGIGFESADRDQLRRYCKQQTLEDNFIAAKNIAEPQGEYWMGNDAYRTSARLMASVCHLYGKPFTSAEFASLKQTLVEKITAAANG